MNKLVIDTSVLIKWFKEDEQDVDKAAQIKFGFQQGDFSIHVPDLVFYEIGNVLRYQSSLSHDQALEKMSMFWLLGLEVNNIEPDAANHALRIAFDCNVTFYDAAFIALAEKLRCPFITADFKLYEKAKEIAHIKQLAELD